MSRFWAGRSVLGATLVLSSALLMVIVPPATLAANGGASIHVDDSASPGGDGTATSPYNTLPTAVAAARLRSTPPVIKVAPGDYVLSAPLVIDFPVDIRGSSELIYDEGDPWPSGQVVPGTQTRVMAGAGLGAQPLIAVGKADGTVLTDFRFSGFVLSGTTTNFQLRLTRVQGFWVKDNAFRAPGNFGFQSTASSGRLSGNHFTGIATGALFIGGYPESPSQIVAIGNRMVSNSLGGIVVIGASFEIPEHGDLIEAEIRNNDLSNNAGSQGFGLRVFILRRDPGQPGDTQSHGHIRATVKDNRMIGNRSALMVDAGFPFRTFAGACDPRVFTGSVDLDLAGNSESGSLLAPALFTFTRNTAALTLAQLPLWQYLHGATFDISDPDGTFASAWVDHPMVDPHLGPCPMDATQEVLNNALIYNGVTQANGRNF